MDKYRKKSVVVEALKINGKIGGNIAEILELSPKIKLVKKGLIVPDLIIETLEGDMLARHGDYIIRGVKGEFYPCKSDIFELTYESVGAPA